MLKKILVQASSRSWSGGRDKSIYSVCGEPVILTTLRKIRHIFPKLEINVIAPLFDKGGELDEILSKSKDLRIDYSHDDSPFERILNSVSDMNYGYVIRLDAINLCIQENALKDIQKLIESEVYDVIKFEDDYPVQLTFEAYKISAIKTLKAIFDEGNLGNEYRIHSKFAYSLYPKKFKVHYYKPKQIEDSVLENHRNTMKELYYEDRIEIGTNYIAVGDPLCQQS